jgi:hypothetical protein
MEKENNILEFEENEEVLMEDYEPGFNIHKHGVFFEIVYVTSVKEGGTQENGDITYVQFVENHLLDIVI